MFKVFYYSAIVLSALLMIVSRKFYYDGLMKSGKLKGRTTGSGY